MELTLNDQPLDSTRLVYGPLMGDPRATLIYYHIPTDCGAKLAQRYLNDAPFHVEVNLDQFRFKEMPPSVSAMFLMSISLMSYVSFKKKPCCPVNFKGQGPPL